MEQIPPKYTPEYWAYMGRLGGRKSRALYQSLTEEERKKWDEKVRAGGEKGRQRRKEKGLHKPSP